MAFELTTCSRQFAINKMKEEIAELSALDVPLFDRHKNARVALLASRVEVLQNTLDNKEDKPQ